MDATSLKIAVTPPAQAGLTWQAAHQPPAPSAPPELVGKFEALMARNAPAPGGAEAGSSIVPASAVSKIEDHLKHGSEMLNSIMSVNRGEMSMTDLYAMQIRSVVQLGVMSATQSAYVQVLGASKGSVNALMKNQ